MDHGRHTALLDSVLGAIREYATGGALTHHAGWLGASLASWNI